MRKFQNNFLKLIDVTWPVSGLIKPPTRTISRAYALELTPEQKQTLDSIHERFVNWCETLQIKMVEVEEIIAPKLPLDPAV